MWSFFRKNIKKDLQKHVPFHHFHVGTSSSRDTKLGFLQYARLSKSWASSCPNVLSSLLDEIQEDNVEHSWQAVYPPKKAWSALLPCHLHRLLKVGKGDRVKIHLHTSHLYSSLGTKASIGFQERKGTELTRGISLIPGKGGNRRALLQHPHKCARIRFARSGLLSLINYNMSIRQKTPASAHSLPIPFPRLACCTSENSYVSFFFFPLWLSPFPSPFLQF